MKGIKLGCPSMECRSLPASLPLPQPHPFTVVGLEIKLPLFMGPAVVRAAGVATTNLPLLLLCDITLLGSPSSLPGQIGAGGPLRCHFLFCN